MRNGVAFQDAAYERLGRPKQLLSLRGEGPLVAAVGVEDLIVVATEDVVLVTRKDHDQDIKHLVARLKQENRASAMVSRKSRKP